MADLQKLDEQLDSLRRAVTETKQDEQSGDDKAILAKAKAALGQLAGASKWTGENLKGFAKQFDGFAISKVLVGDANRDEFTGPYGISAAEHLTPKMDKGLTPIGKSPSGPSVDASFKLFKDGNDYVLRFKVLGNHSKKGKAPMRSVLWLFYLRKSGGGK